MPCTLYSIRLPPRVASSLLAKPLSHSSVPLYIPEKFRGKRAATSLSLLRSGQPVPSGSESRHDSHRSSLCLRGSYLCRQATTSTKRASAPRKSHEIPQEPSEGKSVATRIADSVASGKIPISTPWSTTAREAGQLARPNPRITGSTILTIDPVLQIGSRLPYGEGVSGQRTKNIENPGLQAGETARELQRTAASKSKSSSANDPDPIQRKEWQIQKRALAEKFGETGWSPRKRLSPDTLEGIRALHAQYPEEFPTPVLADRFKVSPEAIRRILKSKWKPNEEEEASRRLRWDKRGETIWSQLVKLGIKPPKKWREMGIGRNRGPRKPARRQRQEVGVWDSAEDRQASSIELVNAPATSRRVNGSLGQPSLSERIL